MRVDGIERISTEGICGQAAGKMSCSLTAANIDVPLNAQNP